MENKKKMRRRPHSCPAWSWPPQANVSPFQVGIRQHRFLRLRLLFHIFVTAAAAAATTTAPVPAQASEPAPRQAAAAAAAALKVPTGVSPRVAAGASTTDAATAATIGHLHQPDLSPHDGLWCIGESDKI